MKLEQKHLAPYLPYHLQGVCNVKRGLLDVGDQYGLSMGTWHSYMIGEYTPILLPLSDLTKEIEHDGRKFVPMDVFKPDFDLDEYFILNDGTEFKPRYDIEDWPYGIIECMFEWHFDVFGLIDAGLAIKKD